MYTRRSIGFWSLGLLMLAWSGAAAAQVTASDKATAEALFDRGLTLLKEGKLEEACARLEQSNAIDHGIGTMLYLAECYEKSGRTASAWALFREASSEAQAAGQFDRASAGRQRAERLEPTLSRLTIEVPDASRAQGLEVSRNGNVVPKGLWGLPLPVDPGEQHIEARAPGFLAHTEVASVAKGASSSRVVIPALVAAPPEQVAENMPMQTAPITAMPAESAAPPASAPVPVEQGLSTQQIVGIAVGGAGVVLLAVGVGFGVRANNKNGEAKDAGCAGKFCNSQKGVDLSDTALTSARVADVGIIGGAALVAGGLVTYFLAPRRDQQTKVAFSADHHGAALHVGGVF